MRKGECGGVCRSAGRGKVRMLGVWPEGGRRMMEDEG